jgi:hypothetical protein
MAFDSTRIVAQMNLKGSLPEGRFTDQELLDFAYDSLLSEVAPIVLAVREDYYVTYQDFTVTADQVAYVVPSRALNGVVREVKYIDGTDVMDLERMDLDDVTTTQGANKPHSFYVSGNSVCPYPTPNATTGTLRVYYFVRPSRIVTTDECARITAIVGNTASITIPTGWTTSNTFDLVAGRANFDILSQDLAASSVAAGAITFTTTVPSTLQVGDYVALAEETCFPMLPPEGHVVLVQSAVTSALESIGDPLAANSAAKTAKLMENFRTVLATRVQGAPKALGKRLL